MSPTPPNRFHGRKTLSNWLHYPLKKIQQKRGFAEGRLLSDWEQIVGCVLAQHCIPQKLSFPADQQGATLHILCDAGWATELQFQHDVVCDKIATFFGYRAVGAIRIHQGVVPKQTSKPSFAEVPNLEQASEKLRTQVSHIEDEQLKESLLRLGLMLEANQNSVITETESASYDI